MSERPNDAPGDTPDEPRALEPADQEPALDVEASGAGAVDKPDLGEIEPAAATEDPGAEDGASNGASKADADSTADETDADGTDADGAATDGAGADATDGAGADATDETASDEAGDDDRRDGPDADDDRPMVEGSGGPGGEPRRPMRPGERRAMRGAGEHDRFHVDPALQIKDRASALLVLVSVGVFVAILLNGVFLGRGGLLTPIPTWAPAPIVTPAPSSTPAPTAAPTAAPTPTAAPS